MRGRPIIQWLLFLGLWAGLALPIALITRSEQTVQESRNAEDSSVMTWLTLRFSTQPAHFELLQNDTVLWQETSPDGLEFETALPISIDEFGAEFVFKSSTPAAGAIEITVEPDERQQRSQTLWVDGDVNETLTFSWSQHD